MNELTNKKTERKLSKAIKALESEKERNEKLILSNGALSLDKQGQIVRLQAEIKGLSEQNDSLRIRNTEIDEDLKDLKEIDL